MYEVEKAIAACNEYNRKYAEELETWASPLSLQARALDIMDYKIYAWPGHGLAQEAPGYQFVEGEYMKADEYDDLLLDPSGLLAADLSSPRLRHL
jgi:hypothetical protein